MILALLALIGFQTTVTIPAQTVTVTIPAQTITLPAPTPVPAPAPSGVLWVYHNGVFSWAGDYSWNTGPINYADTVGNPGGKDIAVPITGQWGGFQPYAPGKQFDTTPYKYLTYCTKPTMANQRHGSVFQAINDVPDGPAGGVVVAGPGITKYGPVPVVGVWGCYKVPLADFGLTNPVVQKFTITDGTGNVPNLFYVDNVGFSN